MLASDHRLPPVLAEGPGASHGGAIVPSVVGVMHNLPSTESDPALLQGLTDHSEERIDQDLIGNADDDESEIAMILASFVRSQSHDSVSSSDEALAGLAEEAASTAMVQQEGKHSSPDLIDPRTSTPRAMSTDSTSGEDGTREADIRSPPAPDSSVNFGFKRLEDQTTTDMSPSSDNSEMSSTLSPDGMTGDEPTVVATDPTPGKSKPRRSGTRRKNHPAPIFNSRVLRSGPPAALLLDTITEDDGRVESGSAAAGTETPRAPLGSPTPTNGPSSTAFSHGQATGNVPLVAASREGLEAGPSTPKSGARGSSASVLASYMPQAGQQVYVKNLCAGKKKAQVTDLVEVSRLQWCS